MGYVLRGQGHVPQVYEADVAGQYGLRRVRFRKNTIADVEGRTIGLAGVIEDITDEEKFRIRLAETQEQLRILAEATGEGIVIHQDNIVAFANRRCATMFGFCDEESVVGRHIEAFIHESSWPLVVKNMRADLGTPYQAVGRKLDKAAFNIIIRARRIEYRGKEARVAIITDLGDHGRGVAL